MRKRYARMRRFRRGRRAWRAHKVSYAYLGDLSCSQRLCDFKLVMERREANDRTGVELPHSSAETRESGWSEGGSKQLIPEQKH